MKMARHPTVNLRWLGSPGNAMMLVGGGHAVWGLVAYRKPLAELLRAGVVDSVGDGIFRTDHSDDARAAGFWFMFSAPLMGLGGYLLESALRAGDDRAVTVGGRAMLGLGGLGMAVMPRSGFPVALPIGCWILHRGRSMRSAR